MSKIINISHGKWLNCRLFLIIVSEYFISNKKIFSYDNNTIRMKVTVEVFISRIECLIFPIWLTVQFELKDTARFVRKFLRHIQTELYLSDSIIGNPVCEKEITGMNF